MGNPGEWSDLSMGVKTTLIFPPPRSSFHKIGVSVTKYPESAMDTLSATIDPNLQAKLGVKLLDNISIAVVLILQIYIGEPKK